MPSYKLTYFDLRARGELCRYVLHAAGQNFVDERLSFEQWGPLKAGNLLQLKPWTIYVYVVVLDLSLL